MFDFMIKMESRNPDFRKYTDEKIAKNNFIHHLGIQFSKVEPGHIEGYIDFRDDLSQQDGWLHGGVTSALLDTLQGFAAYTLVAEGQKVFTIEAKVSYFNPGKAKKFFIRGGVVKPGTRFHFCEGEVYYINEDSSEVIVAKGSATMAIV